MKAAMLEEVEASWLHCTRCQLHKTRNRVVPWRGSPDAEVALVGEAPGADEDKEGVPFVGRAGKKLDAMLLRAGLHPIADVFILNTVACRPPGNREPLADELHTCSRLWRTALWIVQPKVVVMLGRTAGSYLADVPNVGRWRGEVTKVEFIKGAGIVRFPGVVTWHPAYALRAGKAIEKEIVEDLRVAKGVADG